MTLKTRAKKQRFVLEWKKYEFGGAKIEVFLAKSKFFDFVRKTMLILRQKSHFLTNFGDFGDFQKMFPISRAYYPGIRA